MKTKKSQKWGGTKPHVALKKLIVEPLNKSFRGENNKKMKKIFIETHLKMHISKENHELLLCLANQYPKRFKEFLIFMKVDMLYEVKRRLIWLMSLGEN
jgi:hypothetical protein